MSRPGLDGVELVTVRLALRTPWVTALGRTTQRDVLLVRAVVEGTEGWGECVAQAEPTYSAEYVGSATDVLRRHLVPRLVAASGAGLDWEGPAGPTAPALRAVKGHPMARGALEAAVLDACLRRAGIPLASYLAGRAGVSGAVPTRVTAGVAVGVGDDVDALVDEVEGYVAAGYRRVKLKVHPGWDETPVAAVRGRWDPARLVVQVDANGAYADLDDPGRALAPLDDYQLLLVEQPLGDDDLLGHARLAERLRTPICLDESITSVGTAAAALALGACRIVNVKPGRVGGMLEAIRIHDYCREADVPVWCGGMVETGIGRAANLALATLPGFVLPGDLSASARFWVDDVVTEPAELGSDGTIAVPTGPGSGIEVRSDLDRFVVDRSWFPAR